MSFFTHFGSSLETSHNVSASQLEVLVTWYFGSRELPRKQHISHEGKHHVTKTSSWEAETSWIISKHYQKWVKFIHFNMNIGSNNTFSKVFYLAHN